VRVIQPRYYTSDGRLRPIEAWAIYAAFAPIGDGTTLIKVGISQSPLRRIYDVHCGSPFPVKEALWMHVGTKSQALIAERFAHARMAEKKTRGEWLRFTLTDLADKRLFHDSMKGAMHRAISKPPKWNRTTLAQVVETLGIKWGGFAP
jgi:hypothetical protein